MADQFSSDNGFEDKQDLFRRAALLSQRPNDFEDITELTEEDKYWIRREKTSEYWLVPFGSVSLGLLRLTKCLTSSEEPNNEERTWPLCPRLTG